MSKDQETKRVERTSDRWEYVIDMAGSPAYVLVTLGGQPGQDMVERVAADLLRMTDTLVGPDTPFAPIIMDVRKVGAGSERMGAATFQWASSRALRRVTRLVVIFDPDLMTMNAYAGFTRLASVVLPHIEVVYSREEAFERLGLDVPPALQTGI
jgi:hypothetical protein